MEKKDIHSTIPTSAGIIVLTHDGFDLTQKIQTMTVEFFKERGYRGVDSLQALNALLIALAPLIAAAPRASQKLLIEALPGHVVELVRLARETVREGEIVQTQGQMKFN